MTYNRDFLAAYHAKHEACPDCGKVGMECTTLGCIPTDPATFKDINAVRCSCGWKGTVHDLVPAKLPTRKERKAAARKAKRAFTPAAPPAQDASAKQLAAYAKKQARDNKRAAKESYCFGQYRYWRDGRIDTMVVGGYEELEKYGDAWLAAKVELAKAVAAGKSKQKASES